MGAVTKQQWSKEQSFESHWWGDCCNTYGEETKQIAYAKAMGIFPGPWQGGDHWPVYRFDRKSVLDIGGGPASMLLKASFGKGVVVDPCNYPDWVGARYSQRDIIYIRSPAEEYLPNQASNKFDLALIYNVLQHTQDPELIVREACRVADALAIFEWVDSPAHPGHPHVLQSDSLEEWIGQQGRHLWLDEQYNEITKTSKSPVRQHAWAGYFQLGDS